MILSKNRSLQAQGATTLPLTKGGGVCVAWCIQILQCLCVGKGGGEIRWLLCLDKDEECVCIVDPEGKESWVSRRRRFEMHNAKKLIKDAAISTYTRIL